MTVPGLTATAWQPWSYRDESLLSSAYDLSGYGIAASDGEIGKVDQATYDSGASYLVVDTGRWIFGRKVMLPAGVVSGIDHENRRVLVDRTMEQIKNSPEYDEAQARDAAYRKKLGTYYGEGGAGWPGDGTGAVNGTAAGTVSGAPPGTVTGVDTGAATGSSAPLTVPNVAPGDANR